MRVNQKMLDAASDALGYEVDAERVQLAYDELEDDLVKKVAVRRLQQLERQFEHSGGRGVDLAEEIDHLRIFVATVDLQGESLKAVTLTLKVKVPDTFKNYQTVELIERLIACGQEDAENSLDAELDTSDAEDALALEVVSLLVV